MGQSLRMISQADDRRRATSRPPTSARPVLHPRQNRSRRQLPRRLRCVADPALSSRPICYLFKTAIANAAGPRRSNLDGRYPQRTRDAFLVRMLRRHRPRNHANRRHLSDSHHPTVPLPNHDSCDENDNIASPAVAPYRNGAESDDSSAVGSSRIRALLSTSRPFQIHAAMACLNAKFVRTADQNPA